jgi:hypothetical protein
MFFFLNRIEWRRENNAVLPTGGIIYRYYLHLIGPKSERQNPIGGGIQLSQILLVEEE